MKQILRATPQPRLRPWILTLASTAALLLSGAVFAQAAPAIQASAASQIATLQQIKASRTAIEDKLDTPLYMALLRQRGDARLAQLPAYRFRAAGKDGRYAVDIGIAGREHADVVLRKLGEIGAVLVSPKEIAYRHGTIRARIALRDVLTLAGLKEVTLVNEAVPAVTHALDRSEGVEAHAANVARATYGTQGAGQKVCVLSDGIDSLAASQASGDLPAVDVLPGQAGNGDEGTAMLEIVHDIAPAAALGFATAFNGEASFADNIRALAARSCTIIVDDIIYFDESPFQDGPVAVAVNDVTAAGVLYFSSAGNEGNKTDGTSGTWEGNFNPSTAANPAPLATVGTLHNFGDGGNSLLVTDAASAGAILIWAENYTLSGGNAATDYDLYVLNGTLTAVLDSSITTQNGAGGNDRAYERTASAPLGSRLVVNRVAAGPTAAPMFNLIAFRGKVDPALSTAGATRGHSAAAAAFSLAATPAAAPFDGTTPPGPFPNAFTSVNTTESFSADGPRRIILTPTGAEITPGNRSTSGGIVRQKPDLTAADGVSTSAPGFSTFYGTSASAPHAAAIAALLKAGKPSLTPAQVRTALTSTAIDIEATGVDRSTGAGIVMPGPALAAVGATAQPLLDINGNGVFSQQSGDNDSAIEPNETWEVDLTVLNIGGATASAISATLSSNSPDITVLTGQQDLPVNLGPGDSTSTGKLRFRLGSSYPCGAPLPLTLTLRYTGDNSPQQFPVTRGTGGAGTRRTFSYSGPVVAIPDGSNAGPGANANAALNITTLSGIVGDVDLRIDGSVCSTAAGATTVGLDHSYLGDLQIRLLAPDGTQVPVISAAGSSGNNLCQTLLDDESAGGSIQTTGSAPYTGSFKPNVPLSGLDGKPIAGTWTLQAQDFAAADTGSIRAFTLGITPTLCDAAPQQRSVRVSDASVSEGNSGTKTVTVTVTLSSPAPSGSTTSVRFATAPGTASAGSDYVNSSGTLTFSAGQTSRTRSFTINGDIDNEGDETFFVNLSSPVGLVIDDGQGVVTIVNDDAPALPTASVNDVSVTEGNAGTRTVSFTVTLSAPAPATGTTSLRIATAPGTATAGSDYVSSSGTMTFTAGQTSRTRSVTINGDTAQEGNETFFANLSSPVGLTIADSQGVATIIDDDTPALPSFSINDLSITEGNAGTKAATFTVSLSAAATGTVTVTAATANGTATAGSDYTGGSLTLSFAPGQTTRTASLPIRGDTVVEANETFFVNLSNPTGGATIADGQGVATIVNDD
ncbi:MAG: S8 family serine peptidase [Gammaproteobacteria bacterium]|nr:S8 family serine peptidase [Gammaproteobacteria bacterium]